MTDKTDSKEPKGAYGTIHVTEEEMREAGAGVFEEKSGEAGRKKAKAPANKMQSAPANKSTSKAKGK